MSCHVRENQRICGGCHAILTGPHFRIEVFILRVHRKTLFELQVLALKPSSRTAKETLLTQTKTLFLVKSASNVWLMRNYENQSVSCKKNNNFEEPFNLWDFLQPWQVLVKNKTKLSVTLFLPQKLHLLLLLR